MITIPNRPFASERITGLMLPDGIFVATLGRQNLHAQFHNIGGARLNMVSVFLESASHPHIHFAPRTHAVANLENNASHLLSWELDLTDVPAGVHHISFVAEANGNRVRVIKKIFVTRIHFDDTSKTISVEAPEGLLELRLRSLVRPADDCFGGREADLTSDLMDYAGANFSRHSADFKFCPPGYFPSDYEISWTPNPPFEGQFGELPFQDPWWKVLFCLAAVVLLIAAGIAAAEEGGEVTTTVGGPTNPTTPEACPVSAEGGGSSYVAAGLVAAAAAAATIAAHSDERDILRLGEDQTHPAQGELTTREAASIHLDYVNAVVALGRPFEVKAQMMFERETTGNNHSASISQTTTNVHTLSKYEIDAPAQIDSANREPFIVQATFLDENGEFKTGNDLFVQCHLVGPEGQLFRFSMQDSGVDPDGLASDGLYTGIFDFSLMEREALGTWTYYVIAQDVNHAQPDMAPEDAAQMIGGIVVTHQLALTMDGSPCQFNADGQVEVV